MLPWSPEQWKTWTNWLTCGEQILRQLIFPTEKLTFYKQLLDEVFVISRIIEVEVGVITRSRRLRLIILTETSIILDITKTESNNCFIIHWTEEIKVMFLFLHWRRNHAPRSYMTWLLVTLSVLDMIIVIICSYDVTGADSENSLYAFGQWEKRERVQCIIIMLVGCRGNTLVLCDTTELTRKI